MRLTELVEQVLPADAEFRLEAGFAVVDARVDDLAVARGGFCADGGVALDEDGGRGVAGEVAGDGEADDTAADDLHELALICLLER
jgi:hypothetical protein